MDKINIKSYKAHPNSVLDDYATKQNINASKEELKEALKSIRKDLWDFHDPLYAHAKYNVLICLQCMDTAGKDSLIREVFMDFNVRGGGVHRFKVPTDLELKHDLPRRHYIALPA